MHQFQIISDVGVSQLRCPGCTFYEIHIQQAILFISAIVEEHSIHANIKLLSWGVDLSWQNNQGDVEKCVGCMLHKYDLARIHLHCQEIPSNDDECITFNIMFCLGNLVCSLYFILQNNASKLLLAIMESRHDSENAERILYNMSPKQLVRFLTVYSFFQLQ